MPGEIRPTWCQIEYWKTWNFWNFMRFTSKFWTVPFNLTSCGLNLTSHKIIFYILRNFAYFSLKSLAKSYIHVNKIRSKYRSFKFNIQLISNFLIRKGTLRSNISKFWTILLPNRFCARFLSEEYCWGSCSFNKPLCNFKVVWMCLPSNFPETLK